MGSESPDTRGPNSEWYKDWLIQFWTDLGLVEVSSSAGSHSSEETPRRTEDDGIYLIESDECPILANVTPGPPPDWWKNVRTVPK